MIELLSYVATLHLALTAIFSDRWTSVHRAIVAGQAASFLRKSGELDVHIEGGRLAEADSVAGVAN